MIDPNTLNVRYNERVPTLGDYYAKSLLIGPPIRCVLTYTLDFESLEGTEVDSRVPLLSHQKVFDMEKGIYVPTSRLYYRQS